MENTSDKDLIIPKEEIRGFSKPLIISYFLSLSDSEHPHFSVTSVGAKDMRQIADLPLTFAGQGPDILKIP